MTSISRWIQSRRRRGERDVQPDAPERDRDSGEEEYESAKEDAREASPSGLTRVKTDKI
jgi:hypothetical protein